jgi:hypothetical protein
MTTGLDGRSKEACHRGGFHSIVGAAPTTIFFDAHPPARNFRGWENFNGREDGEVERQFSPFQ